MNDEYYYYLAKIRFAAQESFIKSIPKKYMTYELNKMIAASHIGIEYIDKKKYGDNTIIITMGAGDVYKISEKLDFR